MSKPSNGILKRVLSDILLFVMVPVLPWWALLILFVLFLFYFDSFYEVLFAGLFFDSLYAVPNGRFHSFPFILTVSAGVLFVAVFLLKKRLKFYGSF